MFYVVRVCCAEDLMCIRRLLGGFVACSVFSEEKQRSGPLCYNKCMLHDSLCGMSLPAVSFLTYTNVGSVPLKSLFKLLSTYMDVPVHVHTHFDCFNKWKQRYNCPCSVWLSSKMMQKLTSPNCP